jgi:CheY-like chemotaxis protein
MRKNMKALYIEDNAGHIYVMRKIARFMNCDLHVAQTGRDGLAMLDESYDLLLLDIGLPDSNGLLLTAGLRPVYPRLPIIAVSANVMQDDRERCLAAGCTDYLSKPFEFQEMVALLKRYRSEV